MKLNKIIPILLTLLFIAPCAFADKGMGIAIRYEIETGMYSTGLEGMISAFNRHIRILGQGVWAEDVDGAGKQVSSGIEAIYVPRPDNTFDFYISMGSDVDYIKDPEDAATYVKGAVGAGIIYQFGEKNKNGGYLGYRGKTIGGGEEVHEATIRLLWAF